LSFPATKSCYSRRSYTSVGENAGRLAEGVTLPTETGNERTIVAAIRERRYVSARRDTFKPPKCEAGTMSDTVVSASWLDGNRERVTLVDVREAWEYDAIGHIPGAVNVPFDRLRADEHAAERGEGEGMLPGEDVFASLLGEAGIRRDDEIVAYDDHHGVFAARVLVTALLYGHPREKLHLLDGDFSAWQRERETSADPPAVEPVTYDLQRPAETPLVTADAVAAAIDDAESVVVDTRERWEYDEGHIPGAVHLDWRELVDDETRGLRPSDELEATLADRGVTRERHVVLYCNTARRISHTYFVLSHLEFTDVSFYEGSLTEWEAMDRPVESAGGE
jgi:thiosulfate/3-mercaptopyruvate sulfurtransferase